MKFLLLIGAIFTSISASAGEDVLKHCLVTLKLPDSDSLLDSDIRIVTNGQSVSALVTQKSPLKVTNFRDSAEISEHTIRAGLTGETNPDDLNDAERLILHAMLVVENPILKGDYSVGFDLSKVRSAKVFYVGRKSDQIPAGIIEARDADGEYLGSFLGGYLVGSCKEPGT